MSDALAPRSAAGRPARTVLVAVLTLLGLVLPAVASLPAAAAAACDGVTVRVERAGRASERCAAGDPDDGLEALEAAGHRYTFVPGQAGMVCTIDGYPDPCNDAPADAYWSYWHAEAGASSWTYATRGAGDRDPAPGSHEAWVFGAGKEPRDPPPPPAPAPSPSPSPTTPPPSSGDGSSGGSGGGSSDTSPDRGSADRETSPSAGASSTADDGDEGSTQRRREGEPADEQDDALPSDGETATDHTSATDGDDPVDDGTTDDAATDAATDDADADADPDDDEPDDDTDDEGGEDARPEASDDTVTLDAPEGGGGSGTAATVAALLVVGIGAAGVQRARSRRDDLGTGT